MINQKNTKKVESIVLDFFLMFVQFLIRCFTIDLKVSDDLFSDLIELMLTFLDVFKII